MPRKVQPEEPKRATLQMPRSQAQERLRERIAKGKELLARAVGTREDLNAAGNALYKWSMYNEQLLRTLVDSDELVDDYTAKSSVRIVRGDEPLETKVGWLQEGLQDSITRLESILERLDLIPMAREVAGATTTMPSPSPIALNRVFIVHGHDEAAKQSVARFIERLGLAAIILHEQPDQGKTVIEKFEAHGDVSFAVVLLTPDDLGAAKGKEQEPRPRARQNVILELGYFYGHLGRGHVCALYSGDVELPSDLSGVLWVALDSGGAWQVRVAKEMKAAGLDVDLNRLV